MTADSRLASIIAEPDRARRGPCAFGMELEARRAAEAALTPTLFDVLSEEDEERED